MASLGGQRLQLTPLATGTVEAKVLVGGQRPQRFCLLFSLISGSRRDETTTGFGSIEEFEMGSNRNAASDDGQERQSRESSLKADLITMICLSAWLSETYRLL